MKDLYPRVMQFVREQPWALMPTYHTIMVDLLSFRNAGGVLTQEEIASRIGSKAERPVQRVYDPETDSYYREAFDAAGSNLGYRSEANGAALGGGRTTIVAVLGIYGMISQRASQVDDLSGPGGTSVERFMQAFRSAVNDPNVKAIVIDVDSPGGGVYGVPEAADEMRAARGSKPIIAVANSLAASAAYWLAAQADSLSVTPSGEVGSVGVYAAHEDVSAFLEKEGRKITLVSAGEFKTEGNPFEPLGEEAKAFMKARIDEYHGMFKKGLSRARGVSVSKVESGFGGGRVFGATEAVDRGMADRVETLDEAVRRVSGRKPGGSVKAEEFDRPFAAANQAEAEKAKLRLTHNLV